MEDAAIDVHEDHDANAGIMAASHSLVPLAAELRVERPRERLWRDGTRAIGDAELLAMILGSGVRDHPAVEVACDLLRSTGGAKTPVEDGVLVNTGVPRILLSERGNYEDCHFRIEAMVVGETDAGQ